MTCTHDIVERDVAIADGMCPLCMKAEIERLRAGPEDDWEERGAAAKMQAEIERLRAEREEYDGADSRHEIWRLKAHVVEWKNRSDRYSAEIERLRAVEATARAFEAGLSEYCDGPERDVLRAALQAIWKALEEEADHELATLRIKVITRNALGKP